MTKTFNEALFASLGVTAFYILFDQPTGIPEPFQTSENAGSIWVTGRVGYNVIPQLYVFAEGDGIFQRFVNSVFNTDGYRVMGGLGTKDPNSLIRGEIYGGYQAQQQLTEAEFGTPSIPLVLPSGIPTFVSSGVFGGRISYYPTQYWTLIGSVDQVLGISTQLSPGVPEGASFEGDHRIGTDELRAGAQLVGGRPGRLHSRLLFRARSRKMMAFLLVRHSIMRYGAIC